MTSFSVQLYLMDGVPEFFTTDNKKEAYQKALEWLEENKLNKDSKMYYDCIHLERHKTSDIFYKTEEIKPDTTFKKEMIKQFFYGKI